jgi:hypothetical protein
MYQQPGPDWWQASDGQWYPPQQYRKSHTSQPRNGATGSQKSNDPKKDSRSFGERVTTTQAILGIIVSLVTLGGSAAIAIKHFTPHGSVSSQSLTVGQVKAKVLTTSDLAIIDKNLTAGDVQYGNGNYGSCKPSATRSVIGWSRTFTDAANGVVMWEAVLIYNSFNDAHAALKVVSQSPACSYERQAQYSVTNLSDISSRLAGLCADGRAWTWTLSGDNFAASIYYGTVLCGRAAVSFGTEVRPGSSFDNVGSLVTGMGIAVPKVEALPSPQLLSGSK